MMGIHDWSRSFRINNYCEQSFFWTMGNWRTGSKILENDSKRDITHDQLQSWTEMIMMNHVSPFPRYVDIVDNITSSL